MNAKELNPTSVSRRTVLKVLSAAGAGLVLGFHLLPDDKHQIFAETSDQSSFEPNAWLRIEQDGTITVTIGKVEMGQGVHTALPMIVAEELDADWTKVRVQQADAHEKYGRMGTGGSASVRTNWETLRKAGAAAREMLLAAAAKAMKVPERECRTEQGFVLHTSGKKMSYGELVPIAATLAPPQNPTLKSPTDFKLIGKPTRRLDHQEKITGKAIFGIDVKVPNMLVAVVVRPPVFGSKVKSVDDKLARQAAGVKHIVQISSGVAVVADGYWNAMQAREKLKIKWEESSFAKQSSETIRKEREQLAKTAGAVAKSVGDAKAILERATKRLVNVVYEVPYLAHTPMEPPAAVASVESHRCEIWASTQVPDRVQSLAAELTGLPKEKIIVHTTFLGGGFGRKLYPDYVADAIEISNAIKAPVKVIWSREDDIQHDLYRPSTYNVLSAALDDKGEILAWTHKIVGDALNATHPKDKVESAAVEGAQNLPYRIPNLHVEWVMHNPGVPTGAWRSVGSSQNAFITECFIDELAYLAGKDPLEFRHSLLENRRLKRALELVAEKSGWGKPLPEGVFRGIACHESFRSAVAEVAEVSVDRKTGHVKVHRVVVAIDCGLVVNPLSAAAQMEGGVIDGLSCVFKRAITIKNGRVEQANFNDYDSMRIDEAPKVEVHFVPSTEAPTGTGEPGLPPAIPAVCNAIFAATGKRIRKLPIAPSELRAP
ncbi:MAG: xanthine dehydrogenase family protein molybdopterin-binding subunit [Chloroherpetonaceae bacterium]|nr:xanthine dehydrogenase family protein molybdopterin-binding subunit [Chloroherpetonaceae bacterium]